MGCSPTGTKSLGLAVTEEGTCSPPHLLSSRSRDISQKVFRHLEEGGARAPMLSVLLVPMGPTTHTVPLLGRPPSSLRGPWKNTKNGGWAERPRRGEGRRGAGKLP